MKLTALKLYQFKNHRSAQWSFEKSLVAISGLNGKGKTNILDAICLLCQTKSYFSSTDSQCIQDGEIEASIIGVFDQEEKHEIIVKIKKGQKKEVSNNGKVYSKLGDHLGKFLAVVIAPGDIYLIYGDNSDRRKFIDKILSQVDGQYLNSLLQYNRLLAQRNQHLKSQLVDHFLLDSLDVQMKDLAESIFNKRKIFIAEFISLVNKFYEELSGGIERTQMHYKSQLAEQDFCALSAENRQRDIHLRRTNTGIHKDEIDLILNGHFLKRFGSQGQIKSYLISLKLAEFEFYREKTGQTPLLLLDDIFEKIDDNRANALTRIIKNGNFGQLFATDTHTHRLSEFCSQIDSEYQLISL